MASFPQILLDHLWHSTTWNRYESILNDGAILPNPQLPDSSRWCTGQGPKHYPYVRTLGGVSLFDFTDFDPIKYSKTHVASWFTFVPLNASEGNPVWVEIDRTQVSDSLIEGSALLEKWKKEKAYGHNLMPLIEAAHIGPICVSKFARVLHFSNGSWNQVG